MIDHSMDGSDPLIIPLLISYRRSAAVFYPPIKDQKRRIAALR